MKNLGNLILIILGVALIVISVNKTTICGSILFFTVGCADIIIGVLLIIRSYNNN